MSVSVGSPATSTAGFDSCPVSPNCPQHQTAFPSSRNAQLWRSPVTTWPTFEGPTTAPGTASNETLVPRPSCPLLFSPQQTTDLSVISAHTCPIDLAAM